MKFYKIFLLLVFTILLPIFSGSAQDQHKIDSLKSLVENDLSFQDKISIYKNICWEYATSRTHLDSAKLYADSILYLSTQNEYEEGIALSNFYYGIIDRFSGNYYEALRHFDKNLKFHEENSDSLKMEFGLFQKGVVHYNLGNYAESLTHYYTILNIYQKNNMRNSIGTTWHSIGHIQRIMKKQEEAIESYEKAIEIKREFKDTTGIIMSLISLGNTYGELKRFDLAEEIHLSANEICKATVPNYLKASVLESLGNVYHKLKDYNKATGYYEQAIQLRSSLPSKKGLAENLNSIGLNFTSLKKYDKADKHLKKSMNISKEINAKPILLKNYKALKELNQARGNLNIALNYQDLFVALKDSIFDQEKNNQLIELETKYKLEQKEQNIQLLLKEKQLQEANSEKELTLRKTLIASLLLAILFSGLLIQTMRQRFKNQKVLLKKNEEIKQIQYREQLQILEMKALRAQMNPHFLFNCLNSINTMILNEENENASKYLSKFSKLVRLMLENSEQPMVSLKDELSMLKAYIQLENLRFNDKIDHKIEVKESIDQENTYLPSMVLQPFVENAIWHGLLQSKKGGLLSVFIKEENEQLYCKIKDNGIGREKSMALQQASGLQKKSMGINITKERLSLLTKQKVSDTGEEVISIIDLKDEENQPLGTEVNIQIPIS